MGIVDGFIIEFSMYDLEEQIFGAAFWSTTPHQLWDSRPFIAASVRDLISQTCATLKEKVLWCDYMLSSTV